MSQEFDLEILLPVHNEADSVRRTIEEAYAHISKFVRVQFIVSEDGSTDGTKEILHELSGSIPMKLITDDSRKGYLTAMRDGIRLLEAPYLLCLDSDGQCDPADFEEFWKRRDEAAIVMGWRVNRADNALRKVMSRAFRAPYRMLFGVRLNDPSCCYLLAPRAIAHRLVDEVCELTQGFQWEFIARAHRKGIPIHEVPVNHRFRASGRTQVFRYRRIPGIAISHLISLFKIWAQTRPATNR